MRRRHLLATAAGALAAPSLARAQASRTLRFVPITDLPVPDPIVSTTYITRTHAFMVWDTLYGLAGNFRPAPQMAAGHRVSQDGRVVEITLRPGLRFHDGEAVRAADAVASIRRWAARDPLGQTVLALTDELAAPDDTTIRFRLKRPFPLLFDALAKTSPPVCFIMPERLAATDPARAITEMTGSGPFRYVANERVAGARVVYERFAGYVPRGDGLAEVTAGPKHVHLDRVEWVVIPDAATAAAALQQGEVDWWEFPTPDLLGLLRRHRGITVETPDPTGFLAMLRFNQLHPPFDNPAARRALLPVLHQADFMAAVAGSDPAMWRTGVGFFPPGTPMASEAGLAPLTGPRDAAAARSALAQAGAAGARVRLIGPSDYPNVQALTEVAADALRRAGLDVDHAPTDWATVVQRRANRAPPDSGGWNALCTFFSGLDFLNPAVHLMLRGNGLAAWPGWPTAPALEALRQDWLDAPDLETAQRLAEEIQARAMQDLPAVPLGQFFQPTAYRRELTGVVKGPTAFWNLRRS